MYSGDCFIPRDKLVLITLSLWRPSRTKFKPLVSGGTSHCTPGGRWALAVGPARVEWGGMRWCGWELALEALEGRGAFS